VTRSSLYYANLFKPLDLSAPAEAPGVIQIGSTWYMYFASVPTGIGGAAGPSGSRCIGVATLPVADNIATTPFTPSSTPVVCDTTPADNFATAAIDPSPFYDPSSGNYYLLFKTNNLAGTNGTIESIPLGGPSCPPAPEVATVVRTAASAASGGGCTSTTSTGEPLNSAGTAVDAPTALADATPLLSGSPAPSWEKSIVENPSMAFSNGVYDLFFSGGYWGNDSYSEGWASCAGPVGPCTDESVSTSTNPSGEPLLTSTSSNGAGQTLNGPGGGSWFPDASGEPGDGWLAIHSWTNSAGCASVSYPSNCYSASERRGLFFVPMQFPEAAQFLLPSAGTQVNAGTAFTIPFLAYGYPTPTVALAPGSTLPPGVTFADNAVPLNEGLDQAQLTGTASVPPGNYTFTVMTSNALGSAEEPFVLTVGSPPAFTSPTSDAVSVGQPFSFTVTTTGAPPPELSTTATPPGVTFTDNGNGTATITGTASVVAGVYGMELGAWNNTRSANQYFTLSVEEQLPDGTTIGGIGVVGVLSDGEPELEWEYPTTLTTQGCADGSAAYAVTGENIDLGIPQTVSGSLTESPVGSGTYTGTIPPLAPIHGQATVAVTITCPNASQDQSFSFDVYIDPGGTVVDTDGNPIVGATVTLLAGPSPSGPFTPVPNGSTVMSAGNRSNPDTTSVGGSFGWDVTPGAYEVQASAPGCTSPSDPTQPDVLSAPFTVPPPLNDLQLTLACTRSTPAFIGAASDSVPAGSAFTTTIATSGSPTPAISDLAASNLPAGVTLVDNGDGTATLSGTSSVTPGTYLLDLAAVNGTGGTGETYTLSVGQAPAFTSSPSQGGSSGAAFADTITATGSPTPSFSLAPGLDLPQGVTLIDNGNGTASLSGGPSVQSGTYTFGVIATSAAGTATQLITLHVTEAPAFTTPPAASVVAGSAFSEPITAAGFPTPQLSVAPGSVLPAGVTLTTTGGGTATLSGTASVAPGIYTFGLVSTNTAGTATQAYTLTVVRPVPTISVVLSGRPSFVGSGPLSSGTYLVESTKGVITSVTGTGTFIGSSGGLVTVTVDVVRVGPVYVGVVNITAPSASIATTALIFTTKLTSGSNGEVSGTGLGLLYKLTWTV
jgi:hypothetical protein